MAKSDETLIQEITAEATAKGVDVPVTEGKNNAELAKILKNLKARKAPPPPAADKGGDADKTKATDGDTTNDDDDDPEPDTDVKAFPYSVAPGKSITAKGSRILADGDEITKKDIPGDAFKAFLKSGHIKKG